MKQEIGERYLQEIEKRNAGEPYDALFVRYSDELLKREEGKPFDEAFILAYEVRETQARYEEASEAFDAAEALFKEAKTALMVYMENGKMESFRMEKLGLFSLSMDSYPSINEREKFMEWIRESGNEPLLTVNSQTLRSLNKNFEAANGTPIPGCTSFYKPKLSIRK